MRSGFLAFTHPKLWVAVCCFFMNAILTTGLLPDPVAAQEPPGSATRAHVSRAELAELLDFYERSFQSSAYSERLRTRAQAEAQEIRSRLELGDFQVGDRVVLRMDGQQPFPDTLVVLSGQVLRFPELGELTLRGALRSELESLVVEYLERYVRNVRLESTSLVRMQFSGAVARPGFHNLPAQTPLGDAIMIAGGPVGGADLDKIRVVRRGETVLSGEEVQIALAEGRTLDQLDLRGGDRVLIPERGGGVFSPSGGLQLLSALATLTLSIVTLLSLI